MSISDGDNDKESRTSVQLSSREESEVIDILHQILEDADPYQLSTYTILERLRDECDSEYAPNLSMICSIDPYKDFIIHEIDMYVAAKQKENARDDMAQESSENPSLDTIFIVSNELQAITKQSQCSGKEVWTLYQLYG